MQAPAQPQRQRIAERAGLAGPVEHAPACVRAAVQPLAERFAEQSGEWCAELSAETRLFGEGGPDLRLACQDSGPERRAELRRRGEDPLGHRLQLLLGEALL